MRGTGASRRSGDWTSARRYVDRTLVLETTFTAATGVLVLTDLLALGPNNGGHRLGRNVRHLLVRRVACASGSVEVNISYAPRPEYGLVVPLLAYVDGDVTARGGAEWLVLTAPVSLKLNLGVARGRLTLDAGQTIHLALHRSTLEQIPAHIWSESDLAARVDATVADWRSWSDLHQAYDGPWCDLVQTSGRVLQGLTFQPSGAIVAAATTSLPEGVRGERPRSRRAAPSAPPGRKRAERRAAVVPSRRSESRPASLSAWSLPWLRQAAGADPERKAVLSDPPGPVRVRRRPDSRSMRAADLAQLDLASDERGGLGGQIVGSAIGRRQRREVLRERRVNQLEELLGPSQILGRWAPRSTRAAPSGS
jgi:hypothetical protein